MSNPCITRDQLMEAVERLPPPEGSIGSHHIVEVLSQETGGMNVNMMRVQRIEFELVQYTALGRNPTPMWKFLGYIDLNEHDDRDTEILRLLMNKVLGAKGVRIIKYAPSCATLTALFRNRSSKRFKRRPLK
jgi:hypothetical protein